MLAPLHVFLEMNRMGIDERRARRGQAASAAADPAAVELDADAAEPYLRWARQEVVTDLNDPKSATFSGERVVRLPDGRHAGTGVVECTNAIGARNTYAFLVRPGGMPVVVDILDPAP